MAQIEVEPNTVPARTLSDDVYLLAGLLGEVLQSSSGDRAFALTEEARAHAKALRSGDRAAGAALDTHGGRTRHRPRIAGPLLYQLLPAHQPGRGQRTDSPHPRPGDARPRTPAWFGARSDQPPC